MSKMIRFDWKKWNLEKDVDKILLNTYLVVAMDRTSFAAEATVKDQITKNGSVMTGNLRNSVEKAKTVLSGSKLVGGVIAGSDKVQPDAGADVRDIRPSMEYAGIVDAKKPFMRPAMERIKPILKKETNSAIRAFSRSI